ncbi:MAG: tRNA (adenosine(37)-N6)-threonylcarbamoyltransferase complex ATPase subunit type 1 TsaE [Comamonadaceae bacterium]|nr:MAG: tRNA (adenosine(37)-N6)-threonylcarbamoyltransferase complex ATPase subunit type 1 TsaE [Comamonadaceae bacterium]
MRRTARHIVHACGDDTHGARHQLGGAGALQAVRGHVGHFAVETVVKPLRQSGLGGGHVHTRHANLGKSQFAGPSLNTGNQLDAVERHLPIVGSTARTLVWTSEDDTGAFAARLAALPALRNAFIELHGDLGAGKTTFVRHLLRALGIAGRIKSPTYAVVEPHETADLQIWHFDFYRFSDPREWEEAGFRDIFASPGLKLAEWPEKAAGQLPTADLALTIDTMADESRHITLTAHTPTGHALLDGAAA